MLQLVLPIKVVNISFMHVDNKSRIRLPMMQDQVSLTLSWRSFSGWGRECITAVFAFKCSYYLIFECLQAIACLITMMQHQNHWCSIDTHFQHGTGSVLGLCLTWMAANTSLLNACNQLLHRLHKMHSQTALMLWWRSFSEWGSHHVVYSFAKERFQYVCYALQQPG
jgi:hypothetical protein